MKPPEPVPAVIDRCDLIDGINRTFLAARLIIPVGLDGGNLVCAAVDPGDDDSIAALAFASGRTVLAYPASPEAILAALGVAPPRAPVAMPASAVPHAASVMHLRARIIDAADDGADRVTIMRHGAGATVSWRSAAGPEARSDIDLRTFRALIAAADALIAGRQPRDAAAGFVIADAGRTIHARVEPIPDGRLIHLETAAP